MLKLLVKLPLFGLLLLPFDDDDVVDDDDDEVPLTATAAVAAANVSAIDDMGHKLVVWTRPRSKWKQSKTDAPTELRRVTIELTIVHLFSRMSYFSTEFSDEEPSFPPKA